MTHSIIVRRYEENHELPQPNGYHSEEAEGLVSLHTRVG